ncbi:MAG: GspL/Epsl periplasmic domain-containing protein, partial [Deltaproteobacteria bacterium]
EISDHALRMVTAEVVKGIPVLSGAREQRAESTEELSRLLREALADLVFGDRVVASLPAVGCFHRDLEFPFGESKKIEPAVVIEMSSQVPTGDELVYDFLSAHPLDKGGFLVPAAAVRRSEVVELQEVFRQADQSLHLLDVSPFGYAAGLAREIPEGVLAVVLHREVCVAKVSAGRVEAFRSMPRAEKDSPDRLAEMIHRDYLALAGSRQDDPFPLFVIGEGAGEELVQSLAALGVAARYPDLEADGQKLVPALLPAAALAMRAAAPGRTRRFNFLQGDLAPKNEWAVFRRQLIVLAVLLAIPGILFATGAYLNYTHQQQRAEFLRKETVAVFSRTFPDVHTIVDAPAQMRSKLAELQKKTRLLGLGREQSALAVLREVSARTPPEIKVDIRELIWDGDQVRLEGATSTFDAVNRLSQSYQASPLFDQVQIADAKMSVDSGRIDFRFTMKMSGKESQP